EAAHEATLRNLLQRRGYEGLEAGRAGAEAEGEARGKTRGEIKGLRDSLFAVLSARRLAVSKAERARILAAPELPVLGAGAEPAGVPRARAPPRAQKTPRRPRPRR